MMPSDKELIKYLASFFLLPRYLVRLFLSFGCGFVYRNGSGLLKSG